MLKKAFEHLSKGVVPCFLVQSCSSLSLLDLLLLLFLEWFEIIEVVFYSKERRTWREVKLAELGELLVWG